MRGVQCAICIRKKGPWGGPGLCPWGAGVQAGRGQLEEEEEVGGGGECRSVLVSAWHRRPSAAAACPVPKPGVPWASRGGL